MAGVRSVFAVLLLLATFLPSQTLAQPTEPTTYADPAGRFTVPVPTGWHVEERSGYVVLTDPDQAIDVRLVVVQAPDVDQGIAAAWKVVDAAFNLPIASSIEPPVGAGVEHALNVNYNTGDQQRFAAAYGQQVQGTTYAVLVEGSMDALARRSSQVNLIATGLRITSVKETSLVGTAPRPLSPAMIAELERYTADTMQRLGVPGASVAVVQGGQVVYAHGFGVREQGGSDLVTPDTLMMIGSTTKTMTTLLMAQLVDAGALRWDEPVVDILPTFAMADPAVTERVTVKNLVCACTGVPRRDMEILFGNHPRTAENVIASLQGFQFFTQPGEAFQYSNQMVATGGYIAALAAGGEYGSLRDDYVTLVQQRIFDPIGMPNTTFSFDRVAQSPDAAWPHGQYLDGSYAPIPMDLEYFVQPFAPAGGVWSSADDMARYLITQLHGGVPPDGTRIVSAENLGVTWTPQVAIDSINSYGLGWIVSRYKSLQVLQHGGNTLGFTSDFAMVPEADLGVVVLSNARASNTFNQAVRQRVLELVYGQPAGSDATVGFYEQLLQKNQQELAARAQPLDAEAVAPFLGSYSNDALGAISLSVGEDGTLTLQTPEWSTGLQPVRDDQGNVQYVSAGPPQAGVPFSLVMEADGTPVIVLTVPPDTYRFTPVQ